MSTWVDEFIPKKHGNNGSLWPWHLPRKKRRQPKTGVWPFTVFVLIFGTFWMFQKGKGWMALFLPKKVGGDGWRLWKPTGLEFLSAST